MEDEDLEEMKFLREKYRTMEAVDNKKIIGFKFDLNSATKRSQTIPKSMQPKEDHSVQDPEDKHMSEVMGFSTFGRTKSSTKNESKSAQKFDIEKLLAERPNANKWKTFGQSSGDIDDKNDSTNSSETKEAPNKDVHKSDDKSDNKSTEKQTIVANEDDSDSDSDLIGPPLPPGFQLESETKEDTEERSDDEL
ncbi:unnamed protein product, partial [Oppiella nova]